MTLGQRQEVFTKNLGLLIDFSVARGLGARIREVQRTDYQQAEYIRTGKTKTSNSQHLKSLAADIYFTRKGLLLEKKVDLQVMGDYWESLHPDNVWGGSWKTFQDLPHFEMRG